ncbi:hypothetical protein [uncultured Dokdonia sp.]|uniref:hypothetical protein n=1 Tax=uncultured Dokdonia sp. TaxID=575653 RepID=UPI00262564A6|nr:hypothetical protein [uncultured Dokdonia sp.]
MSRTIAEIQTEILDEKERQSVLAGLTNESKTAIWRVWTYIVASAIWIHEQIVERNARISRPHTLDWYRSQALDFIDGRDLIFRDGFFEFDTVGLSESEIEDLKIVKHCAVSEIDLETIINPEGDLTLNTEINQNSNSVQLLSDYFHNQVGVVFMKVAKNEGENNIVPLNADEQARLREFIRRIKDAGNQIQISSIPGDKLKLDLRVYVDPLLIYVNPNDPNDPDNGILVSDGTLKPVEKSIKEYLKNIEFNGALVKTFLIDAIQGTQGVNIPILDKMFAGGRAVLLSNENLINNEFYIPNAGYFNLSEDVLELSISYFPYTFYRNNQNIF